MAFSTQKDFFNVPFMNERYNQDCKKSCVKLKSYGSTIDTRAWATDETKQSNFLSDLVTCQHSSKLDNSEDKVDLDSPDRQVAQLQHAQPKQKKSSVADDSRILDNETQLSLQLGHDSLLECANIRLAEYQNLLKINTTLEKELEISKEYLKTANEEKAKIREILANKPDSNISKDFYNKIQQFTAAGKFDKNEESVMLQIYQKIENMDKSNEILQAENYYLKRLIEKLTERVALDDIPTEPEQSEDIGYLLRQTKTDYHKLKQLQTNNLSRISEQDAQNIKTIIKERNSLREKCKTFTTLAEQLKELELKTQLAKRETVDLRSNLCKKTECIEEMQMEMQKMQKYYEEECHNASLREDCLKAQLANLKEELIKAKCEAQKADLLCMEVSSLRNEVLKRDLSIDEYDCQYKELMDIVNELQSVKLQCLHDNQTQTCLDQTDELVFYTSATLKEIMKELQNRGCFSDGFSAVYRLEPAPGGNNVEYDKQCCQDMKRLQKELDVMAKERQEEELNCADAQKYLKELESENAKLLNDNQVLNEKVKQSENKMVNMLQKIETLDTDIISNSQESKKIGKELQGAIDLVKDISDLQLKNQQLANAVSTINSRDDEKIIEDLRRQLEEEVSKLKKCEQNNTKLLEEAKLCEMDLKELKELNNKLLHENSNLKKIINLTQSEDTDDIVDITDESRYVEKNQFEIHNLRKQSKDKAADLDEYVISTSSSAPNTQQIRIKLEVSSLDEPKTSLSKISNNEQSSRRLQNIVEEPLTSTSEDSDSIQPNRSQQNIALNEFVTSSPNNIGSKQLSLIQQESESLDELVTFPSKDAASRQSSLTHQDVDFKEFVAPPLNNITSKQPSQPQQDVTSLSNHKQPSKPPSLIKQEAKSMDELLTLQSKEDGSRQLSQELTDLGESVTSPPEDAGSQSQRLIKQKDASLDDFERYPSKDSLPKHPSQAYQKIPALYDLVRSPSKDSESKQPNNVQMRGVDLMELPKSPSKGAALNKQQKLILSNKHTIVKPADEPKLDSSHKQPTRVQKIPKALNEYDNSLRKDSASKQLDREHYKEAALDDFVSKKTVSLKHNLQKGQSFEKEFRNILEEFILECSNCFCRSFNRKSKLYDICHRLCHKGLDTLTFRELAYLHKKIYAQADQLIPGCLLDMILSDHKEQIERILISVGNAHKIDNKEIDSKISDKNISSVDQKCCCCKSDLCCSYSEEMLKDKVNKLEIDIGIARKYLETLRNIPVETNIATDNGDSSDTNNSTYRASSTVIMQQKSRYSNHLKKLKSRMIKHPNMCI